MERTRLKFSQLQFDAYASALASADPTPGGGSGAAAVGALGAALVSMVALLTSGAPKFAHVADRARKIAESAERLRAAFVAGVDDDIEAYNRVTGAYRLPKATEQDKSTRSTAIQQALLEATAPPLRTAELARDTCALAVELVEFGNPNAISDIGCAALFAEAAARGAAFNVAINAKQLKDREQAQRLSERLAAAIGQVGLLAEVVLGKVEAAVEPAQ